MYIAPFEPNEKSDIPNRRVHARKRFDRLTYYAEAGPDGGFLSNLSEGGLRFQGFRPLHKDEVVRLDFRLPGAETDVQASARVVWINESEKGGGLQFVDLSAETRQVIQQWIVQNSTQDDHFAPGAPAAPVEQPAVSTPGAVDFTSWEQVRNLAFKETPQPELQPTEPEMPTVDAWREPESPRPSIFKSEAKGSQDRQYLVFGAGMLAGSVAVLAAIAGLSMLGGASRPTTAAETKSSVAGRPLVPALPDSSDLDFDKIDKSDLDFKDYKDLKGPLLHERVDLPPLDRSYSNSAHSQRPVDLDSNFETKASGTQNSTQSTRVDSSAPAPAEKPLEKKPATTPNLALQAPARVQAPSDLQVSAPAIANDGLAKFAVVEGAHPVAPAAPELPTPSVLAPATSDRTANFLDAVPIKSTAPAYPDWAKDKHIQGVVKISATIGTDGVPWGMKLVSGDSRLAPAAIEAISHWRYVPAVSNGVPVESQTVISINFQ